jgi:hypothetical protein
MIACGDVPKTKCEDIGLQDLAHSQEGECPQYIKEYTSIVDNKCTYSDSCGLKWSIYGCFINGSYCQRGLETAGRVSLVSVKKD